MNPLSPLPRTLAAALRDAGHAKFKVRVSALRDLGRLAKDADRKPALDALVKVLREDDAPGARAEAAVALADAEAREATEVLTLASRDENDYVRQMALLALGEVAAPGDPGAVAAVERALRDRAPSIRFQALIAWSRLLPERTLPPLLAALDDEDREVRYIALRLGEERGLSEPLLERAQAALSDDAAEVQLAAAILLARAQHPAGHDVLVRAVNDGHGTRQPEDENAAVELAGDLALQAARRGLERRAFGGLMRRDRFAWQARTALAKMGDRRAIDSIVKDLSAWLRDTRTLAVAAAGKARVAEARAAIEAMRGDPNRADPDAVADALAALGATGSG
jgi:HEAT repeat protein